MNHQTKTKQLKNKIMTDLKTIAKESIELIKLNMQFATTQEEINQTDCKI